MKSRSLSAAPANSSPPLTVERRSGPCGGSKTATPSRKPAREGRGPHDWRFHFKVPGKNTCSGDSGGPAFLLDDAAGTFTLVGVTSAGGKDCSWGMNTRVDAYRGWLDQRMR